MFLLEKYDIFISYRRDGGDAVAGRISDKLTSKGYKVFFDVESMRSGDFNEQIYEAIDLCTDMIVVLPPGGLDRCESENDWVRLEIAYAIKKNKNIIPVMLRNFSFPQVLPEDINYIRRLQGVSASMEYFDATVSRMESLLVCNKKQSVPQKNDVIPKNKIKIPFFLGTPVHFLTYSNLLSKDELVYWWEFFSSEDLTCDASMIEKILSMREKYGNTIFAEYPYFLLPDEVFASTNKITSIKFSQVDAFGKINILGLKEWQEHYRRINDISLVPKRYKDDTVDPQELMHEISELSQTCFYNDDALYNGYSIAEMVYLGKKLIGEYPRRNDFSFYPVIDFCFKCCVSANILEQEFREERLFGLGDHFGFKEKNLLSKVSYLIQDSVEQYSLYEDAAQTLNMRIKLFLKFYLLVSMFLDPEKSEKAIKKHLLINYKYLKNNGVVLTNENDKLFEKLVNVYSSL